MKSTQDIEKEIVKTLVKCLLDKGYMLSVVDEFTTLEVGYNEDLICAATEDLEECSIRVFSHEDAFKREGAVILVFGNDGWDVIADYSVHLEDDIKPALELAKSLENG